MGTLTIDLIRLHLGIVDDIKCLETVSIPGENTHLERLMNKIANKEKRDKEIEKMEEIYGGKKYENCEKIGEEPNNPVLTYKGLLRRSIGNQYDLERKLLTIKEVVDMTEKNIIEPTISVDMISKIIFQDKKGIEEVKKFIED